MRGNYRKDAILDVAATLFAESSYRDVSLRDIANKLNIKAPSIYNYFSSKEQILDELLDCYERQLKDYEETVLHATSGAPPQEHMMAIASRLLPGEKPMMCNVIKIIFKEQYWNERAREIVRNSYFQNHAEQFKEFFGSLRQDGIYISEYEDYYAEILARLSVAYALDYALMGAADEYRDKMSEIGEFVMQMALNY